jgi:hypothetical protein
MKKLVLICLLLCGSAHATDFGLVAVGVLIGQSFQRTPAPVVIYQTVPQYIIVLDECEKYPREYQRQCFHDNAEKRYQAQKQIDYAYKSGQYLR